MHCKYSFVAISLHPGVSKMLIFLSAETSWKLQIYLKGLMRLDLIGFVRREELYLLIFGNIVSRWCHFKIFIPNICNNLQNALSNLIVWRLKNIFFYFPDAPSDVCKERFTLAYFYCLLYAYENVVCLLCITPAACFRRHL